MKKCIALTLLVCLLAAVLCGCADTNRTGNVSTTDDGYVNGTNDGMYGDYADDFGTGYGYRGDGYARGYSGTDRSGSTYSGKGSGSGVNSRSYDGRVTPYAQ